MPIHAIDLGAQTATQKCAACGADNVVRLGDLVLGDGPDSRVGANPDAIRLPACACGATEWVFRTWDTCPAEFADSFFAEHRRLVNGLAQVLRNEGRSHPAVAAAHAAERHAPGDIAALPARGRVAAQLIDQRDAQPGALEVVTPGPVEEPQPEPPVVVQPLPVQRAPAEPAAAVEAAPSERVVVPEPAPVVQESPATPAPAAREAPAEPAPAEPAPPQPAPPPSQ